MTINDFITPEIILSDVLKRVDDERYEINSKGYYMSLIQQALEQLSLDTFFDERYEAFTIPQDGILPFPENAFNLKEIWLFNGETCDISRAQNVYWKRNYYREGVGSVQNNAGNNPGDPFMPNNGAWKGNRYAGDPIRTGPNFADGQFYFNIVQGDIIFSPRCAIYQKAFLKFNGLGTAIGDAPVIPRFLRDAIKDWCTVEALQIKMAKEPNNAATARLHSIYDNKLNAPFVGSWHKAEMRVKLLDGKKRSDLKEYLSRGNW